MVFGHGTPVYGTVFNLNVLQSPSYCVLLSQDEEHCEVVDEKRPMGARMDTSAQEISEMATVEAFTDQVWRVWTGWVKVRVVSAPRTTSFTRD